MSPPTVIHDRNWQNISFVCSVKILLDQRAKAKIADRIDRLALGDSGDVEPGGERKETPEFATVIPVTHTLGLIFALLSACAHSLKV
jgi:hypothetical protein